ncbi:MAG: 30S ribosomal protein S9 [Puniceicoccales bacterium]|jgi:small subunit ribosomal protein S9|nr:30S ribosomal protein S9 [Puniceicoccales bacterium]
MEQNSKSEFYGTGRRKCAIARVRLGTGAGNISINGKDVVDFCSLEHVERVVLAPLAITNTRSTVDVRIEVSGGGIVGQAGAVSLGIARALEKMTPELRLPLKKAGLLTRDSRVHERKKSGQRGARKRFQFSKR